MAGWLFVVVALAIFLFVKYSAKDIKKLTEMKARDEAFWNTLTDAERADLERQMAEADRREEIAAEKAYRKEMQRKRDFNTDYRYYSNKWRIWTGRAYR